MRSKTLIPDPDVITIEQIVPDATDIVLVARTRRCTVPCPVCLQPARLSKSPFLSRVYKRRPAA